MAAPGRHHVVLSTSPRVSKQVVAKAEVVKAWNGGPNLSKASRYAATRGSPSAPWSHALGRILEARRRALDPLPNLYIKLGIADG
jgi:hypothetical protein